ncbi:MAG TPA: subclass B3 metallo-beta-lactamase [Dyella sp.]|nr:subclass B3 metallo-beta-lactamase [Dyella sp.]
MHTFRSVPAGVGLLLATGAASAMGAVSPDAAMRTRWHQPQAPTRIYGNTWYVGSRGLGAILITSPRGHVLIDGTLAENAPMIEANIRALGFRLRDVRLILNTHAHADHAGAIAALAHDSGAVVVARAAQARALREGGDDPEDPQQGDAPRFPPVRPVRLIGDEATVRVGPLAVSAHPTPGHTPGSTTWTWISCEGGRCLHMVYADSLTPMASGNYRFTAPAHPQRLVSFRRGLAVLSALPCDILMTPHPEASRFWQRMAHRAHGDREALRDTGACRAYARNGERMMGERIAAEHGVTP